VQAFQAPSVARRYSIAGPPASSAVKTLAKRLRYGRAELAATAAISGATGVAGWERARMRRWATAELPRR
jgi:hypothetical protein